MTHPVLPPFNAMPTQRNRRLLLSLPAAVALPSLITACGGGADLSYETEQALYFVDEAITPNKPQPALPNPPPPGHTAPKFTVFPPLPAGLTLNAQTGVISGTPTKLKRQGSHLIIASNNKGIVQTQVRITVTGRGAWVPGAKMGAVRMEASISTLLNGKILVAGGSSLGPTNSVEIYNPSMDTWSSAAPLPKEQSHPLNVVLRNGRVLALGGTAYFDLDPGTTALYDPSANTWTATGHLNVDRLGATAHLLPDGKVLALGGYRPSALNSAELYDPVTGAWTPLSAPLLMQRANHSAVLLPDGKTMLVVGGFSTSAELYKVDGSASKLLPYAVEAANYRAVKLDDGSVLVVAHERNLSSRYNPVKSSWTTSTMVTAANEESTLTVLADGRALMTDALLNTAQIYNPDVNRWTAAAPMATARRAAAAALLGDGSVLVAGGLGAFGRIDACERYIP